MIVPRVVEPPLSPLPAGATLAAPLVPGGPVDAAHLSYALLRPESDSASDRAWLTDAYRCWHTAWAPLLRDLDHVTRLFSDDFTRQDEIGALTYRRRCIGVSAFRFVDMSMELNQHDSYFRAWPSTALTALVAQGPRICVGSNFALLAPWRSAARGMPLKEVLMGLAVQRFLASQADAMAGMVRNDRGMDRLVYRMGATPIVRNVLIHGIESDLVVFFRSEVTARRSKQAVTHLVRRLWRGVANEGRTHADAVHPGESRQG